MPSNILRRKCGCIFYTLLDCRWVRNNRNEIGSLPCLRLVRVGFCRRHGTFFSRTERTLLFLSRTACFLRFLGFNHPKNIGNILRSRWLHLRHSWLLCSTLSGPFLIGAGLALCPFLSALRSELRAGATREEIETGRDRGGKSLTARNAIRNRILV